MTWYETRGTGSGGGVIHAKCRVQCCDKQLELVTPSPDHTIPRPPQISLRKYNQRYFCSENIQIKHLPWCTTLVTMTGSIWMSYCHICTARPTCKSELRLWSVSSVSVRGLGAGHRPGCQDESINILTLHCILTNTQLRLHFLKLYL